MADFVDELKRRHIYRVAAAYAVVAWVLLQIVNNVAPVLDLPVWVARACLLLLAIGFPVALLFAWMRELPANDTADRARTSAMDWALFGALILVLGFLSYQQFVPASVAPAQQQAGVEAARVAAAAPAGISVAVLPFTNLSTDKEQEFFSDGVTEDIVTALAKIPDLRVVARESAFQYKGEKTDMRAVGQALNATHLISGSVRKAGTRVRINAQLVKAEDGVNIWAETFDRELTDVFAIQEDIARAIATSLRMPLGLKLGENLISNRPKDQQTYELYLRGVNALRARSRNEVELLDQVVARDPNYAPGWAKLADARRETASYYHRIGEDAKVKPLTEASEAAARTAIALAPDYAAGYGELAAIGFFRGKWAEAIDLFKQALALDPDEPELLESYSNALRSLGYLKQALDVKEHQVLLEPLIPLYDRYRAELLLATGKTDAGQNELLRLTRAAPSYFGFPPLFLAASYAQQGRFADGATLFDRVLSDVPDNPGGLFSRSLIESVTEILHALANKTPLPLQLPAFYSELNFVYAYTPTPERMLEWSEQAMKQSDYRPLLFVWWPTPPSVRKTERFKGLVREAGLVDYWKARGWPDLCHPIGADDFACD